MRKKYNVRVSTDQRPAQAIDVTAADAGLAAIQAIGMVIDDTDSSHALRVVVALDTEMTSTNTILASDGDVARAVGELRDDADIYTEAVIDEQEDDAHFTALGARLIRLVVTGHYIEATRIAEEMDEAVSRRIERTVRHNMPTLCEVAA